MESSAFKEAFDEIRKLSMDPDTVQLAINREIALRDHIQRLEDAEKRGIELGRAQGREQGKAEGKAQGKEQTEVEIVLQMHAESLPVPLICKVTKLSAEKVQLIIDSRTKAR